MSAGLQQQNMSHKQSFYSTISTNYAVSLSLFKQYSDANAAGLFTVAYNNGAAAHGAQGTYPLACKHASTR